MASTSANRALLIHAIAYVTVNAVLLAINAMQTVGPGETREWWVIWPIAGWGIGLAAHAFAVWAEQHAKEGQLLADPDIRGVAVHLFVYLAVNTFLVIVNLMTSPETLWFIWPILGWGVGLAAHAYLVYRAVLKKTVERYATEQEMLTQIQLERRAAEIAAVVSQSEQEKEPAPKPKRKRAAAKTRRRTTKKAPAKKPASTSARKSKRKPAAKSTPSRASRARTSGAAGRTSKTASGKRKKS